MNTPPRNDELVALARRFLQSLIDGTSNFDGVGPLADCWISTQSAEVMHRLARGNPQLRADLEELFRNYFLQGFFVAIRATQEEGNGPWRASECSARSSPRT
jgi:hypothetical protein